MAFNALWSIEALAKSHNTNVGELLGRFLADFEALSEHGPVFRLSLNGSGTHFVLSAAGEIPIRRDEISSEPGFYCIFTPEHVVYLGEANNLRDRLLKDADGTAGATKLFMGQRRAILKYLMHFGYLGDVGIDDLLVPIYPGNHVRPECPENTFGSCYQLNVGLCPKVV